MQSLPLQTQCMRLNEGQPSIFPHVSQQPDSSKVFEGVLPVRRETVADSHIVADLLGILSYHVM